MAKKVDFLEVLLIVEDDQDHAELIKESLKKNERLINKIYCVENGQDALDYVRCCGKFNQENAPPPGLILLDVKLPQKDGFEVLEELKSDEKFKRIPVVMVTTTSNPSDIDKALRLGANDYIVKPVQWNDFEQKIGALGKYWAFTSDSKYRS